MLYKFRLCLGTRKMPLRTLKQQLVFLLVTKMFYSIWPWLIMRMVRISKRSFLRQDYQLFKIYFSAVWNPPPPLAICFELPENISSPLLLKLNITNMNLKTLFPSSLFFIGGGGCNSIAIHVQYFVA